MADTPPPPRYVTGDQDRHGNWRIYARKDGIKTRLRGPMFSEAFWQDYRKWETGTLEPKRPKRRPAAEGSFQWLCEQYYVAPAFTGWAPDTRRVKRLRLESISRRVLKDGKTKVGDVKAALLESAHLSWLLAQKQATPHGANNDLKALRALFKWAVKARLLATDPSKDVGRLEAPDGGIAPWEPEDREKYRARHPIGTKARLALELVLFTGVRISDASKLGKPHLRQTPEGEVLQFVMTKGSRRKRRVLVLPVLPALRAVLDASSAVMGDLTFLATVGGRPHTLKGLGNWFKRQCQMAGLEGRSMHGVRKLAAATMAENGATAHQLMAVFGWEKIAQAEVYTQAADRARMTRAAMPTLEQAGIRTVPLSEMVPGQWDESGTKALKSKAQK